jgi:mRNA-degrading endonuclease toxin of MazEF toxin-antitoxin module
VTVGDVYWVDLPSRGGRAQTGRRPAIIFQRDLNLPTVLLIPLTSQQDALRFAGTVLVEPDKQNGLHQPSVALVFQLTAVDKKFITDKLGKLSDEVMDKIWEAFDEITGRK